MLTTIERGTDGRYSAYGVIAGRPFVADGETVEEAQNERQVLKYELLIKDAIRALKDLEIRDRILKWA